MGWQKGLDSGPILRMRSTEFADSLHVETEMGREGGRGVTGVWV